MIIHNLNDLPSESERALIINVSTKLVSTLALLSTLRYAGMPVLLVDCESKDGSYEHFANLMSDYDFDLLKMPLKSHGGTLDDIFRVMKSDRLLLVDSDLEILSRDIVDISKKNIDAEDVFGAGFVNGPTWTDEGSGGQSYFHERLWMPFVLLKTNLVREAIQQGSTFEACTNYNGCPEFLTPLTSRFPLVRTFFSPFRKTVHGQRPETVFYDTGAKILDHLRYERMLYFAGLPLSLHEQYVKHFYGTTRSVLQADDTEHGGGIEAIEPYVRERLLTEYGYTSSV